MIWLKNKTPILFFFLCAVFSLIATFFITQNVIDSDAASELILAEHLFKTKQLLSADWFYSTELRVLNTQLVFAPLFGLFSDWHIIRYVGAIILQLILVLSFYAFTRLLKLDDRLFFYCGGLMLLPLSIAYGRIVLYHSFYVPHISLSLILIGLTFNYLNRKGKLCPFKLAVLGVLSFLGGLGGVRQLMMTHLPVIICVLILFLIEDNKNTNKACILEKGRFSLILTAGVETVLSLVGFLINKLYLSKIYNFKDYSIKGIKLLSAEKFNEVLYGFFHHFGFRDEIGLVSPLGILSVLGLFLGGYSVFLAIRKIKDYKENGNTNDVLPSLFYLSFIATMLLVFLIVGEREYFVLYFVPLAVFSLPIIIGNLFDLRALPFLNIKKLIAYFAVLIMLANAFVNTVFLIKPHIFSQRYEGLTYQNIHIKREIGGVVDFLKENDYAIGYATFWNSNIITEITNGEIRTININFDYESGNATYYDWLTLKENREIKAEKYFLLAENRELDEFKTSPFFVNAQEVYKDGYFTIYELNEAI